MRVSIVTPTSLSPLPPRLKFEALALLESGVTSIKYISPVDEADSVLARLVSLKNQTRFVTNEVLVVYDLLTLVYLRGLALNNKIVYECIDDFPFYYPYKYFHSNRGFFSRIVTRLLCLVEVKLASRCNALVVNSLYLEKKFNNALTDSVPVLYVPYSSMLESLCDSNNAKNHISLVYIGTFSKGKGADTCLGLFHDLSKIYADIKLYIFGTLLHDSGNNKNIFVYERMDIDLLKGKLKEIMKNEYLYGLSLIRSLNHSYKVQEANKDIDYLACGIPIIGNRRKTTRDLIEEGAGVYYDSLEMEGLDERGLKERLSRQAISVYKQRYSSSKTRLKYRELIDIL